MARPQTVLTVVAARRLTPHLVRLTLGGEQFDAVHARWAEKGATDQYVKLLFADPALGLEPPYDLDALRERLAPEQLPVRRTYTVRRMDAAARTMDVDFVVHGASDDGAAPGRDGGLAGAWAASEPVGQQVAFLGPGGAYRPDPTADWHLLAGDEAALPIQLRSDVGPDSRVIVTTGVDVRVPGSAGVGTGGMVTKVDAAGIAATTGIPTLLTAVYHPGQAMIAAAAGATYIAPYLGRLADAGRDALGDVLAMHELLEATGSTTRVLLASIRDVSSMVTLALR